MPTRILLEGRPGVGKTTVVRRLAALLLNRRAVGFTTEEIRQGGTRTGFALETLDSGLRGVLAGVDLPGPPRVGRYGVDLDVMERLALPPLRSADPARGELVLIDELGRMELACTAFQDVVRCLFTSELDIVATVHAKSDPFTDALKRRADIELVQVNRANRDALPEDLAARFDRP
ncbi:NTPase [Streptomyces libani]|uniref:NTPase n=1 Tax=Streptomyces nigrescens TaxID=1920 RepID=A0A640TD68_STRNI|nr:NTPase [Streptomyces libani]MCX5449489.1 NTPase [Streptomyces libani]WAT94503.1 NTPase [Streptomyces libani subsp. libani]GFE19595.1 nucleoside-triphosphatase THEP1 [Streptomyces libani subsp. libani]GGW04581.1 nucleoside-triphosphatase THEP1 [Streptomyces libani subsp. libani]